MPKHANLPKYHPTGSQPAIKAGVYAPPAKNAQLSRPPLTLAQPGL